jgi:hypothetical protein
MLRALIDCSCRFGHDRPVPLPVILRHRRHAHEIFAPARRSPEPG